MTPEQMIKIIDAANSHDPNIRIVAAFALCFDEGQVLSNTAVHALRRLANDPVAEVASTATSLLAYAEPRCIN